MTTYRRVPLRTGARLALATLLALVGLALAGGPASAHAQLTSSDPVQDSVLATAPGSARFTFNEPIHVVPGAVHLYAADESETTLEARIVGDRALVVDLPAVGQGTAVVSWRVVSADGHPIAGSLTFSVGTASSRTVPVDAAGSTTPRSVDVALAVVQALVYLGLFLTVGLVAFLVLLLPRTAARQVRRPLLRVAWIGAAAAIASSILLLPVTTVRQRGDELAQIFAGNAWRLDLGTPDPWAALILVIGVLLCTGTALRPRCAPISLGAGVAALASLVLVGHTRSTGPEALVISADLVHVLAGSVWLGGLVGLTMSLRPLADQPVLAAQALSRFSATAAGLLTAVGLTGSFLAWRILGSWGGFVHTSFGRALLVKLGIVALVLVLAAHNRWRLLPAVRAQRQGSGTRQILRVIRIEGLLLIAVLSVTGVLVDRSPEPAHASAAAVVRPTTDAVGEAPGVKVLLHLETARIGANTVELSLEDGAGRPLKPFLAPTVSFSRSDLDLGDQTVLDHGSYFHIVVTLPTSGNWTARVSVPVDEFSDQVVDIPLTIGT